MGRVAIAGRLDGQAQQHIEATPVPMDRPESELPANRRIMCKLERFMSAHRLFLPTTAVPLRSHFVAKTYPLPRMGWYRPPKMNAPAIFLTLTVCGPKISLLRSH